MEFEELSAHVSKKIALNLPFSEIRILCQLDPKILREICKNENFWREKVHYDFGPNIKPEPNQTYINLYLNEISPYLMIDPYTPLKYKDIFFKKLGGGIILDQNKNIFFISKDYTLNQIPVVGKIRNVSGGYWLNEYGDVYKYLFGDISFIGENFVQINESYGITENNVLINLTNERPEKIYPIPTKLIDIDNKGMLGIDVNKRVWNLETGKLYNLKNIIQVLTTIIRKREYTEKDRKYLERLKQDYLEQSKEEDFDQIKHQSIDEIRYFKRSITRRIRHPHFLLLIRMETFILITTDNLIR